MTSKSGEIGKFSPERLRFEEASEKRGYQLKSDEFDKNGKLGEIGNLMKFCRKDLDLREQAKDGGIKKVENLTKMVNVAKLVI